MRTKKSIVTMEGDEGLTSFPSLSAKVRKSDIRIELIGALDELQSWIAYLYEMDKIHCDAEYLHSILYDCQALMSSLATGNDITDCLLSNLENHVELLESKAPDFSGFIIPGGSVTKCVANISRTVARRAERVLDKYILSEENQNDKSKSEVFCLPMARKYLNRLSDYLFLYSQL